MNNEHSSRGGLDDRPFAWREAKGHKVFLSWRGQPVMSLKGAKAEKFLRRVSGMDDEGQQLEMARITGNFKRGNEGGETKTRL